MANTLLQLSGLEFEQAIEQELAENPALELEEEQPCSDCELAPFMCKDCPYGRQAKEQTTSSTDDLTLSDIEYLYDFTVDPDEQNDPIARISSEVSLKEHLTEQLGSLVSGKIYEVGEYLLNYIDDRGYLTCDLLEVTLELDATDDEIAEAVAVIQTLDPPGVGAQDLRDCLLIQLRYLAEEGMANPLAERIVSEYWDEMKARKYQRIARRLKVKRDQVLDAMKFIVTKLNPYPAAGFRTPWDNGNSDSKTAVRPDVVIRRVPTGYEIDIVGNEHLSLVVNPYYRKMYNEFRSNGKSRSESDDERKHFFEYVERADLFIKNLNQRRKTLRNIARCIADIQHGFLDTGSKMFLRPLTRVKVAQTLGMHESTISRATSGKYVQLPNQEVVPFDFFFQSSPSITDMIAQLIAGEDVRHPLSDQELANILTDRGYPIARRTVVKYREAQKILSSRQRRRA